MKKTIGLLLVLLLLLSIMGTAVAESVSFTHPEIGEFMTIDFHEHVPYFSIYGYVYYELVNPAETWRGLQSNAAKLVHSKMPSLEQTLNSLFDSVEGLTEDLEPVDFMYLGGLEEYDDLLANLERKDRVKAIRILGGFDGAKGYRKLNDLPGFEDVDAKALEESFEPFTVRLGKTKYEYRVLMFHVDEGDWVYYNERYTFLKVSGNWKLARVTKEYTDDYGSRGQYMHGMTGSDPQDILMVNQDAMLGFQFGQALADIEESLQSKAEKNTIVINEASIYRMPAQATLSFSNKKLSAVEFTLENELSYYSAFISLYTRYMDPVLVDDKGQMSWSTNDVVITLSMNDASPSLRFEPYK